MFKLFAKEFFSFTRKERTGIIVILSLILIFLILPFFFPYFIKQKKQDTSQFQKEIALLNFKKLDSNSHYTNNNFDEHNYQNYYQPSENNYYNKGSKNKLFYFDPNTLPTEGWIQLGIKERTANTIQKYIAKGGRFYKPGDISKIWGLHPDEAQRLLPYVRIATKPSSDILDYHNKTPNLYPSKQVQIPITIDINQADTSDFIQLPGIGSKLSSRIVAFREKLGGFYKIEQIAETYALPDSTFKKIKDKLIITNLSVKKININTASVDELKKHPYLKYNIANSIVQYRQQHGLFKSLNEIKKIMLITEEIFTKAEPYLAL